MAILACLGYVMRMRVATLREGGRDGTLVVVGQNGDTFARAGEIAPTLQAALDNWDEAEPKLRALQAKLDSGEVAGETLDVAQLHSPLPRAYEWIDGSAYINHIVLVRKARNAEPPETLRTEPLVYQGGSGVLLAPTDDVPIPDEGWGLDFESELVVILGDTPRGVSADNAAQHIKLITICNDVSARNLIPGELKKGFGFFNSKPASAFGPFAITPDELGDAFQDGRVHLPMKTLLNGEVAGECDAGPEMHFSFHDLIAHITKTRAFTAGTLLGSGTVSNEDPEKGVSCLAERRMREIIATGSPSTAFLKDGDEIEISITDGNGRNVFGTIKQTVRKP